MRGRSKTDWWGVVLEAPDAQALADFYSYLLGWPVSVREPDGAAIQVPGTSSYLSFDDSPMVGYHINPLRFLGPK